MFTFQLLYYSVCRKNPFPDHTFCGCHSTLRYYSVFLYKNKAVVWSLSPEVQTVSTAAALRPTLCEVSLLGTKPLTKIMSEHLLTSTVVNKIHGYKKSENINASSKYIIWFLYSWASLLWCRKGLFWLQLIEQTMWKALSTGKEGCTIKTRRSWVPYYACWEVR